MMTRLNSLIAFSITVVLLAGFLPLEAGTGAETTFSAYDRYYSSPEDVTYPRGYTHRPFIAFYTSLSCPPCMSSAEPAHTSYWEKNGYEDGNPVTTVVFHLRAGGDRDDALYHEDASAWANHQNVIGTPTIFVDDGYYNAGSDEESISQGVEAAGSRSGTTGLGVIQGDTFKRAEMEVYYLPGVETFKVRVVIRYIENQGGPPGPRGSVDLNGFLNIFMVEDMVDAYSSEIDENVTCYNTFRGFAAMKEPIILSEGGEWSQEFSWDVPSLDPDDNQVPIDVSYLFPVAVLYDADDKSSGGTNGWPGATRSINSATPDSTAYDLAASPTDIPEAVAIMSSEDTKIRLDMGEENVSAVFLVYNNVSPDYNGTWKFAEMMESGVGMWTYSITDSGTIYYSIRVHDEKWLETRTDVKELSTMVQPKEKGGGFGLVIPILALLVVLGAALYLFRDNLPPIIATPLEPVFRSMEKYLPKEKTAAKDHNINETHPIHPEETKPDS